MEETFEDYLERLQHSQTDFNDIARQLYDLNKKHYAMKDQYLEYQQVSALLVQDIELLVAVVEYEKDLTKDQIIERIKYLSDGKDKMISDKEDRETRWNAAYAIYNLIGG